MLPYQSKPPRQGQHDKAPDIAGIQNARPTVDSSVMRHLIQGNGCHNPVLNHDAGVVCSLSAALRPRWKWE